MNLDIKYLIVLFIYLLIFCSFILDLLIQISNKSSNIFDALNLIIWIESV